jgi:energy-converting hydrogenase B subunit D
VIPLQVLVLALVAAAGTALVLVRDPRRQAVLSGFFGLGLAVLFLVFQAPDVALSMVVVSAIGSPLLLLLALAKVHQGDE